MIVIIQWCYDNYKNRNIQHNNLENSQIEEIKASDNDQLINPPDDKNSDYWYYINMPLISVNFNELKKKNSDTVAWIKVEGTNINYPVVQTKDNDYYLTHAFDKSTNSAGWVFSDYRNRWPYKNENTIIYGHGRLNGTVFGSLKNVLNSKWQKNKDNYIVKLSTPNENSLWQVFSVYTIDPENYYLKTNFTNKEQYQEFLNVLKDRSVFSFNTTVDSLDKMLTLSTCTPDNQGRIVLHAKLIKTSAR